MADGKQRIERVPGSHPLADQYTKIHFADWNGDGPICWSGIPRGPSCSTAT
jgi:hypothetical protein